MPDQHLPDRVPERVPGAQPVPQLDTSSGTGHARAAFSLHHPLNWKGLYERSLEAPGAHAALGMRVLAVARLGYCGTVISQEIRDRCEDYRKRMLKEGYSADSVDRSSMGTLALVGKSLGEEGFRAESGFARDPRDLLQLLARTVELTNSISRRNPEFGWILRESRKVLAGEPPEIFVNACQRHLKADGDALRPASPIPTPEEMERDLLEAVTVRVQPKRGPMGTYGALPKYVKSTDIEAVWVDGQRYPVAVPVSVLVRVSEKRSLWQGNHDDDTIPLKLS